MKLIIGTIVAIACTLGGYVAAGGHMDVLIEAAPLEIVIMGGTGLGGFIIANPRIVIKRVGAAFKSILKPPPLKKSDFIELLSLMYQIFKLAKVKGMLALEAHVENPEESAIFSAYPSFLKNHHAVEFMCDYLRLFTLGADKPYEIEALMDEELEVHHNEQAAVAGAVQTIADSMPAIGIVAAVLGVIHTMGSISEPPEVLGRLIGGALVGTFMGVWVAYGFIGPMGTAIAGRFALESKYFQCLKIGMLAHLQGFAPSISVEYARKTIDSHIRPTFSELEEATQALPSPT